jgi:hypothetical protein
MPSLNRRATQSKTNTGMTTSQHHVFSFNPRKVPSAFAVLKVNFSFFFSKKSLRLKVYSLGTGTQKGTHINPNKE